MPAPCTCSTRSCRYSPTGWRLLSYLPPAPPPSKLPTSGTESLVTLGLLYAFNIIVLYPRASGISTSLLQMRLNCWNLIAFILCLQCRSSSKAFELFILTMNSSSNCYALLDTTLLDTVISAIWYNLFWMLLLVSWFSLVFIYLYEYDSKFYRTYSSEFYS